MLISYFSTVMYAAVSYFGVLLTAGQCCFCSLIILFMVILCFCEISPFLYTRVRNIYLIYRQHICNIFAPDLSNFDIIMRQNSFVKIFDEKIFEFLLAHLIRYANNISINTVSLIFLTHNIVYCLKIYTYIVCIQIYFVGGKHD